MNHMIDNKEITHSIVIMNLSVHFWKKRYLIYRILVNKKKKLLRKQKRFIVFVKFHSLQLCKITMLAEKLRLIGTEMEKKRCYRKKKKNN